jgi:hypothetical protein
MSTFQIVLLVLTVLLGVLYFQRRKSRLNKED